MDDVAMAGPKAVSEKIEKIEKHIRGMFG